MIRSRILMLLFVACVCATSKAVQGSPLSAFDGTWLVDRADAYYGSSSSSGWNSVFVIKDGSFKITHFCGSSKDLLGTLALVPGTENAVDINVESIDLSDLWRGVQYPKCTVPAIYKIDAGRLVICFQHSAGRTRPQAFSAQTKNVLLLTLVRVQDGAGDFPKDITATVKDAAGHPVSGASLFSMMNLMPFGPDKDNPQWHYLELAKTDARGVATVPYKALEDCPLAARDAEKGLVGMTATSPAGLRNGTATIVLQPQCRIHGKIESPQLADTGKGMGVPSVYLLYGGKRIGFNASLSGDYEFFAPAGDYLLDAYGADFPHKYVNVTVPAGQNAFEVPSIELNPSQLLLLEGKPAPELEGVEAWRGQPQKLADLRGRYVLLDFWGYWCGPCVAKIPTIMALNEQFKDKGLTVISVHVDLDGEIDTVAKLEEKLATIRPARWKGKDITFPVAITSGKTVAGKTDERRGGTSSQYGILYYPTAVLIDREGKVVGAFTFEEQKDAIEQMEKLLSK